MFHPLEHCKVLLKKMDESQSERFLQAGIVCPDMCFIRRGTEVAVVIKVIDQYFPTGIISNSDSVLDQLKIKVCFKSVRIQSAQIRLFGTESFCV